MAALLQKRAAAAQPSRAWLGINSNNLIKNNN